MIRYVKTPDGRLVAVPTPVTPEIEPAEDRFAAPQQEGFVPVELEEEAEEPRDDGLSDILEVTEDDIMGREEDQPDDRVDDLFGVSFEDIMGHKPGSKKPKLRFRRTNRPYYPSSGSVISPR